MSVPPSPTRGVLALIPSSNNQDIQVADYTHPWQPILHSSTQIVLYNPHSHAISVARSSSASNVRSFSPAPRPSCPYCKQTLPPGFQFSSSPHGHPNDEYEDADEIIDSGGGMGDDPAYYSRASDYFRLLAIANETSSSRPSSPNGAAATATLPSSASASNSSASTTRANNNGKAKSTFPPGAMAEGYFKAFFQEEYKLGMGANGSVFLCQHVLDNNPLGHFAVKKIAVGESHSYLLKILREVRLLERLHHPNIVTYHHAWLETCQFSSFGPKVPTLHVLMQWAEGGSLDDFIDVRLGRKPAHVHIHPLATFEPDLNTPSPLPDQQHHSPQTSRIHSEQSQTQGTSASPLSSSSSPPSLHSRSARIRAFRAFQRASPAEKERMRKQFSSETAGSAGGERRREGGWMAVHLLSADEVRSLFGDVVEGLAFLHDKSILHLDLKPGNVLLTWDEGKLIPRAMLSDFGTSRDMITSRVARSGNTGTLEYTSPESLPSPETGLLQQIDSKSDMWSLGMILHKLLFFKLPYRYAAQGDADESTNDGSIRSGDEAGKLRRLEREVLEYPGFKTTSTLLTAFEARRLPRTFLVMLESLLNRVPSGRPSAERVAMAIRDGKLDPLKEAPIEATSTVLVPMSRSHNPVDTEVDMVKERTRLLGLPSPSLLEKEPRTPWPWGWGGPFGSNTYISRRLWIRLCRTCILVAKVLSIPVIYSPQDSSRPRYAVSAVLLGAAVAETVLEPKQLWVNAGLALFHLGTVRLGQSERIHHILSRFI